MFLSRQLIQILLVDRQKNMLNKFNLCVEEEELTQSTNNLAICDLKSTQENIVMFLYDSRLLCWMAQR